MSTTASEHPRCGYCYKKIRMQRNGAWYHDHNASVSCNPGSGSDRKAFPAPARDRRESAA
jgi:hypothetical protein